jgi:outer membrane lipoprotein-sorting protein
MKSKIIVAILGIFLMTTAYAAAQTIEEILAKNVKAHGKEATIKNITSTKVEMSMAAMGQSIPMTIYNKKPDKMRTQMRVGGTDMITVIDGNKGWVKQQGQVQDIPQEQLETVMDQLNTSMNFTGNTISLFKDMGAKIELVGSEKLNDKDYYKIKITSKDKEFFFYIDKETNLEYKLVTKLNMMGEMADVEIVFKEFKDFSGILAPSLVEMTSGGQSMGTSTIKSIEYNQPIDDKMFERPIDDPPASKPE